METIQYINPTINKSEWGNGAWLNEPDKKQWLDRATGLPCLIVRNIHVTGSLCGYVGVTKTHPLYGKDYSDIENDIDVHGGLTYANKCQEETNNCEGICHKVKEGENDNIWWFGFDCAHAGDRCPRIDRHDRFPDYSDSYRDVDYVTREVQSLARQLAGIKELTQTESK